VSNGHLTYALDGEELDGGSRPHELAHDFFSTVAVQNAASVAPVGNGDLWASCWSDDGALYTSSGDGKGFGTEPLDLQVSRIDGMPGDQRPFSGTWLSGSDAISNVWSGANYSRKPTGMLCLDGDIYVAVQDLRRDTFSDVPAATIVRSQDKGRTCSWDRSAPMFSSYVFTTIMFLDYGKGRNRCTGAPWPGLGPRDRAHNHARLPE
jgi:hypothetical protein